MSFINKLIRCITGEEKEEIPSVERVQKESSFVGDTVSSYLDEHAESNTRLPMDSKYYTTSTDGMETIINFDETDEKEYKEGAYDCENFAFTFMANSQSKFGITTIGLVIDWSGGHAYNMLLHKDGSIELYEPQNDNIVEPGSADRFSFDNVTVII